MSNLRKIDSLLKNQEFSAPVANERMAYTYAESVAAVENAVVVVSDYIRDTSRIFCGSFAHVIGIDGYSSENSIWEKEILRLVDAADLEEKYISEIRFFNFIRHQPKSRRFRYYLLTRLRFNVGGMNIDVAHKMFYCYDENGSARYGICVYTPLTTDRNLSNIVIDSLTGEVLELGSGNDSDILSRREKQVLQLIERGLTSKDIADELHISPHTVSRHRQEILAKLHVRNSTEACRIARQLRGCL